MRIKYVEVIDNIVRPYTALIPFNTGTILPLSPITWQGTPFFVAQGLGSLRPSAVFSARASGGVEVQVPYYCRFAQVANCDMMSSISADANAIKVTPSGPIVRNRILTNYDGYSTADVQPIIFRAVSEDFSLGMFISVPLLANYDPNFLG
jgi:hypothetical protein